MSKAPIRWTGGKRRSMGVLLPHLVAGMSETSTYHEPFLGGGAPFFALQEWRAAQGWTTTPTTCESCGRGDSWARLSDANQRLIRMYTALRDNVGEVIRLMEIHSENHSVDYYQLMRSKIIDDPSYTDAQVAAWMIYLIRTCFNGLYRVNKSGGFNVSIDKGTLGKDLVRAPGLLAASEALQGASLFGGDYLVALARVKAGDTVYMDSPYTPISDTANFVGYTSRGFDFHDQVAVARAAGRLVELGATVVLSNHDTPEIRKLYSGFEIHETTVKRTISCKGGQRLPVKEVVLVGKPVV